MLVSWLFPRFLKQNRNNRETIANVQVQIILYTCCIFTSKYADIDQICSQTSFTTKRNDCVRTSSLKLKHGSLSSISKRQTLNPIQIGLSLVLKCLDQNGINNAMLLRVNLYRRSLDRRTHPTYRFFLSIKSRYMVTRKC